MGKKVFFTAITVVAFVATTYGIDFSSTETSGRITIYRPTAPREIIEVTTEVIINQDLMFSIPRDHELSIDVDPGEYLIYFNDHLLRPSTGRHSVYLVDVQPGQEVYVNVMPQSHMLQDVEVIRFDQPDIGEFETVTEYQRIQDMIE